MQPHFSKVNLYSLLQDTQTNNAANKIKIIIIVHYIFARVLRKRVGLLPKRRMIYYVINNLVIAKTSIVA